MTRATSRIARLRRLDHAAGRRALAAAVAALAIGASALSAQEGAAPVGKETYDRWCAGCHGVDGKGAGPGARIMLPRPRDFTRALYQVRTTRSGQLPTDADIRHVIDVGMPGTAMPGWEDRLTEAERDELVTYIKTFSRFFEGANTEAEVIDFGSDPGGGGEERIAEGREAYQKVECWKCHGQAGRGDGESAPTLDDDMSMPVIARDLTRNWLFNGGGTVEDIYRRMRAGLDGTPMPTFQDAVDAGLITNDQLWSIAHYVRSLSPEEAPATREVIGADLLTEGELPTAPTDERWATVERFYIPLVGQIVVEPRWFHPRVDGVWVQALHDGQELALLVSWTDPSQSPDADWTPWANLVRTNIDTGDEGSIWAAGAPDQLVVQFPQRMPEGMERPYFLQGDARRPTYLWRWSSDRTEGDELVATGLGTGREQEAANRQLTVQSAWAEGEWRVLFRRALATPDSAADLQLSTAAAVPVAFQAWDGDNGEAGNQGSISTWYFIQLKERTPATVYAAPAVALALTAGLGLLVVARAQKKEEEVGVVREGETTS
jgi:mono/diheme cytochrome c family protein